ncbi:hypothetical protein ACGK9U_13390 [Mariniflexile sp. HNIBRBA6329]|uniref:hypothetical protein n=1 Tax=Mariniflexile sp. HNIBRBA6329 TaxID=3373088 RepID=UPI00374712B3
MKNQLNFTYNTLFLCALILLIAVNIVGVFINDALIMKTMMSVFVPVFLIFFFINDKSLGIAFISFLLFSFLGDTSALLFLDDVLIEASSVLYILSYFFLLIIVAPKFKFLELNALVGTYLLVVFSIAVYFLYITYSILDVVVPNHNEVLLFGIKSFVLIILTFVSFGVYLNTQTKQSILFLTAVVFLGLSVMISSVNLYYLNNWSLELLYRLLYATALYLMFKCITDKEVVTKQPKYIELKEKYSSDTVLS